MKETEQKVFKRKTYLHDRRLPTEVIFNSQGMNVLKNTLSCRKPASKYNLLNQFAQLVF
jgi:hypothetical protein